MRQKVITLICIMATIVVGSIAILLLGDKDKDTADGQENSIQVVTSFYPTYIIGLNIIDGIDEINIDNLAESTTGCLHDYQLTTKDMKKLAKADVFIMNGGGMESYLEEVIANFPSLQIINISDGIDMLEENAHDDEAYNTDVHGDEVYDTEGYTDAHDNEAYSTEEHEAEAHEVEAHETEAHEEKEHIIGKEGHEGHDHKVNAHVWLNPRLYMQQVENAAEGLTDYIETLNGNDTDIVITQINKNKQEYLDKIADFDREFEEKLSDLKALRPQDEATQFKSVIFHDAFAYLADRADLEVTYTVEISGDTALSAGEIAEVIDIVKQDGIRFLFVEQQYGTSIADRIGEETDAKVYIIDSAVIGDGTKDSYLSSMRRNLETLEAALQQ